MPATDNYKKHTAKNPIQKFLVNNFLNTLVVEAGKLRPHSILDAGCGEGFTLARLRDKKVCFKLTGIDFSDKAIEIGSKLHPDLRLKKGSIYEIPYPNNSFDLVMCTEVLEHLENPGWALAELRRVTKKYCLISVPHEPWFTVGNLMRGKNISRMGNDIEHIQHWSKDGIEKLVGSFFDVIKVKSPFPWTLVLSVKK